MGQTSLTVEQWAMCAAVLTAGTGKTLNDAQMDVWFEALKDIPYKILQAACMRALQESETGFMPTIGLIRRFASEAQCGLLPAASDEWARVLGAIRRFGIYRSTEGIESLSPISQRIVRSIGWGTLCGSDNISVQAGQFRMAYEAAAKLESNQRRLSADVRPRITSAVVVPLLNQQAAVLTKLFSMPGEEHDEQRPDLKRRSIADHR